MRCKCVKCCYNEDGCCRQPDYVCIDENGVCDQMYISVPAHSVIAEEADD